MSTAPSRRLPFFLLLLLSLELAAGPSPAAASKAFLQEECGHVNRPKVCIRLLGSLRWANGCNDKGCLAGGIIGNLCLPKAREANGVIDRVVQGRPPREDDGWSVCLREYGGLQGELERGLEVFKDGNVDEAARILGSLDHYTTDCESAFNSNRPSPMKTWNDLLFDCVEVAADFFLDML